MSLCAIGIPSRIRDLLLERFLSAMEEFLRASSSYTDIKVFKEDLDFISFRKASVSSLDEKDFVFKPSNCSERDNFTNSVILFNYFWCYVKSRVFFFREFLKFFSINFIF